jgi:hypothetical protein
MSDLPDFSTMKHKIVTEKQMRADKNAYVYDIEAGRDMGIVNLPDVNQLLANVIEILEYSNSGEMVNLRKTNKGEYHKAMERKFPQFSDRYFALFQQILSGEDLSPLLMMLAKVESIKSGSKTIDQAEKEIGEVLVDKYVPDEIKKTMNR